ncbi:alpha/beta fold hydrolase [Streptomyces sp. NPDC004647]|uniref:thioesterase II family protein n=1 Tax=Streptomyces sp. NPDC004647 TaxID=3154671 RepID=UPI0033A66F62
MRGDATPRPAGTGTGLRLFCLPYAGGSARLFKHWERELPGFVEVCPIELPGRGTRFGEPPYTDPEWLVEDVLAGLEGRLDLPFVLFGYSLGSLLAFEAARRLEALGRAPVCLVVAAFSAPGPRSREEGEGASFLPDAEFRRRLGELNGTPRELLDNDAFMELMLPVIRADFRIADTYVYRPGPPLGCPVVAFGGEDDAEFGMAEVRAWSRHTDAEFSLHRMPGDHFFLHSHHELLLKELSTELTAHMSSYGRPGR